MHAGLAHRHQRLGGVGLLLALSVRCAAPSRTPARDDTAAPSPVLDVDRWRPEPADAGPFSNPPATAVYCSELAWRVEQQAWDTPMFEVRSDLCLWGVYGQPLPIDLDAGEVLRFAFAWGETWAAAPTTATVALAIDEELLWSHPVPVPGPPGAEDVELTLPTAAAAGTMARLLVSNHGTNTWAISAVTPWTPATWP